MMDERELTKKGAIGECIVEKCLEWFEYLRNRLFGKKEIWCSHLVEYYCIHRNFFEKKFVKDFLEERQKILERNRHRMVINIIPDEYNSNIVGKVLLYNKSKYIHEAKLKVKKPLNGNNLIFWSFDKP